MDTPPLESDLLRHREFLLRLATGLVGGNDAEDLVQDVWAKALTHPPAPGASARGWLGRVARNLAANRFRARGRRQRREQDAARPEGTSDSVAELDERFELGQSVAAAVRALDEPYRAVILLRFFEGLDHAETAARLGLPVATVRTRQRRALARLKERLDREHGGREAWSAALGTWLGRQGAHLTAGSGGTLFLVAGVSAVLILAVGAWWLALGRHRSEGTEVSRYGEVGKLQTSAAGVAAASETTGASTARQPLSLGVVAQATPIGATRHVLAGRVVGLNPADVLAASVRVDGLHREWVWPQEVHATGALAADGSFEIDLTPLFSYSHEPDEFIVRAEHPRYVPLEQRVLLERGVTSAHGVVRYSVEDITVVPAALLRGRVEHEDGSSPEGACVQAYRLDGGRPQPESEVSVSCASDGAFELKLVQASDYALAVLQEDWRPTTCVEALVPGSEVQLGALRLERGSALTGRTLRLGQPEASVEIDVGPRCHGVPQNLSAGTPIGYGLEWTGGRFEWSRLHAESASDARFRLHGLAPVEYRLWAFDRKGTRGSLGRVPSCLEVAAPAEGIELEFDGSLITLDVRSDAADSTTGRILVQGESVGQATFSFRAKDGQASFVAPANTALQLRVELDGQSSATLEFVTPGSGEELRRSVDLAPRTPARLVLQPRGDTEVPIPGVRLQLYAPEQRATLSDYRTSVLERSMQVCDTSGALEIPPGSYWVVASVADEEQRERRTYYAPLEFALALSSGETRTMPLDFALGGLVRIDARTSEKERQRVRFRLLDARGETVPIVFEVHHETRGVVSSWWSLEPWGVSETARCLPPGDYELVLWDDDLAEQRTPVHVVAGETTDIAVTMHAK